MHTASYNRGKKKKTVVILMLMQVCFLLHGDKCFVTNGRYSHFFFPADAQYKALEGWTHPSLANLEGQLHAQDRPEGGKNWF